MQVQFLPHVRVGTSSWSTKDWRGTFYPGGIEPAEMISVYASQLDTVEIDATWYQMPTEAMVDAWDSRTPPGFVFSAKVPRVITHEKYLVGCEEEIGRFAAVMSRLGPKLGPLVLQFPYVAKAKDAGEYATGAGFLARMKAFLPALPQGFQWAVEIRNSRWLHGGLLELLRRHQVSLVFIDYYTMDPLPRLAERKEVFTAPFVYIRFLGNHKEMDAAVSRARAQGIRDSDWGSLLVDRTRQLRQWIPAIRALADRQVPLFIYFNNHYAGYAPGSVELFSRLWNEMA